MITFCIALLLLVAGYFVYGAWVEKVFGVEPSRTTPAYASTDGIDYIPMPTWKVFLIQFLNIAGLGPIFGAIMGILYGPSAYLWIVFGTIFGGAVHDYLSGMLSVRRNGASLPELVGDELGVGIKQVMRVFSLLLMVLVGAVFVINPANLLDLLTGEGTTTTLWVAIIFGYYILATLLPIDKLIGRLYPIFGFALLFMAIGIMVSLFLRPDSLPEFTEAMAYTRPDADVNPIFPMMFISIACGAISGFHATQSPMMARCLKNEKMGRRVFYGAMVVEGIVALIWAAAAIAFFVGSFAALSDYLTGKTPAILVNDISVGWLGTFGGILAMLGVIAAPITSGDTALRSARLIAADFLHISQKKMRNRVLVSLPIFALAWLVMMIDFEVLWRYFAWCNQTLAVFTLWALTVWLARERKCYWITFVPALFMTLVTVTYILFAREGFRLPYGISLGAAFVVTLAITVLFVRFKRSLPGRESLRR